MGNRRAAGLTWTWTVAVAAALVTAGASLAQNPPADAKGKAAAKTKRNHRPVVGAPLKKALPNAGDPLADPELNGAVEKTALPGTYHYKLRIKSFDGTPLASTYYPAKVGLTAPAVLLVHEKDRSGKDFEDPISDLKDQGLAEHLQGLGYAVLSVDLRGQGANPRRPLTPKDWQLMVDDLQAAYQFLVDRNNRGELNLARFGVISLGEGANLAVNWAYLPGGAVSSEGRVSDLGALVLISPLAETEGLRLNQPLISLAARVPLLVMAGERDPVSSDPVKAAKTYVTRSRLNKVEFFPSSLHGYKLLRLEPKATSVILRFFESTIKFKAQEWEPRYNLTPVAFSDIQVVRNAKPSDTPLKAEPAKKKEAEPEKKEGEAKKDKEKDAPK